MSQRHAWENPQKFSLPIYSVIKSPDGSEVKLVSLTDVISLLKHHNIEAVETSSPSTPTRTVTP